MSKFNRAASIGGLIITRKIGDQIVVNGGEMVIEVIDVKGRLVRLAFKASKEIQIQRGECVIEPAESSKKNSG